MIKDYNFSSWRTTSQLRSGGSLSVGQIPNAKGKTRTSWLMSLVVTLLFLVGGTSWSQVSGYSFLQSNGTYTEITGGTLLATASANSGAASLDDVVYTVALPIPFTFNGVSYSTIYVSTNGTLYFGTVATATAVYTPLSTTTTGVAGVIAPWGRDLNSFFNLGSRTGSIRWEMVGTAPNREIVFQWKDFRPTFSTSALSAYGQSFQARLVETSNQVKFVYNSGSFAIGSTAVSGTNIQIGLRGATTADFRNRTNASTVLFTSSTAGTLNTSTQAYNTSVATPGMPTSGLTYTFTPPSCSAPGGLVASAVTPTSATISWNAASPAPSSGYEYEIRTSGAAGSGATGLITSGSTGAGVLTAAISGLIANTPYSIYVRSNCGGAGFSGWSSASNFTTPCNPLSIPYFEGFESAVVPALPACVSSSHPLTRSTTATGAAPRTGTIYQNIRWTPTVAKYVYSAPLALTASTSYDFGAWYLTDGIGGWSTIRLYANSAPSITGATLLTTVSAATNTTYQRIKGSYIAPSTGAYYFFIEVVHTSVPNDMSIDDMFAEVTPTCVEPTALVSSAVTDSSATISWTASITPPANGYDYIVSTSSTPPTGSSTPTGNTASLSVNLTSLPGNTQHFYWVRSNCSGVEQSAWAGAGTFTTQLVVPTPYNEGFATAVQPAGWSNTAFLYGTTPNLVPVTNVVYKNLWVSAPTGNFTTVNIGPVLANQELSYDYRLSNFTTNDTTAPLAGSGNFVVAISTDFGVTYTTLETVANDGISGWRTKSYSLASYVGQNIRLRVTGTWTSGDYYLGFDNFKVSTLCSGTPDAGTVAPVSQSVCPGLPVLPFTASGFTPDAGIAFQWEQSVNAGPWVNVIGGSGATTTTYTPPVYTGGVIQYRLRATCISSTFDDISTISEINSNGNALPLLQPFTNLNTLGGWTVTGGYGIAAGPIRGAVGNPGGYAISNLDSGNTSNNITTAKHGPVQTGQAVSFDLRLSNFASPFAPPAAGWGTIDVQVSTDCGANFTSVGLISDVPTASYKNYKYYLGAYVGQDVVIRLTGTWLAGDYDVVIDNLNIDFTAPVVQSFTPTSACSVGGDVITLTGFGFTGATATIGTTPVTVNVTSDTSMTITTPAGLTSGQYINVTNGIGTGQSLTTLTVNPTPVMPAIVGANEMCLSTPSLSLTNTQGNGVWTSSNEAVATINSISGDVTGLSEGNTVITYTYTENGCSASVTHSLDVREQVAITSQPSPVVVVTGNNSSFSVAATGTGLTYAWEVSIDNGATWSPLSDDATYIGTTTATLNITATPSGLNGYEYHCIVTGTSPCSPETSSSATLAVGNTGIDTHPSNVSLCNGGTATFTVVASGDIDGYQWYEDQGFGPAPITDGGDYSGATTATLTISNTNTSFNGYTYYAIVDGPANDPQSNVATLFVAEGPSVDQQPVSTTVCRTIGTASFTVTTLGTVSSVQWQSAPAAGGPWTNAGTGTTLNIGITGSTTVGTTFYKAVLNGNAPCSAVESDVVTLTVQQPTIVVTPSAATYCAPGSAVTLTASGATSYVWSPATGLDTTTGATVSATPAITTVYTVTGTDALGCTNTTTVTVTAANATTASATTSLAEACPGETVQLNAFGTQAFTPGPIGSYAFTNTTSTYNTIVGAPGTTAVTSISSMDDQISATLTLPFTFNYGGSNFTQYRINSNGWVGFGAPTLTTNYNALNGTVNNVIAVFNRDLNGNNTTATSYYVQTTGTAPNRITKIEWVNVRSFSGTINPQTANFQLWLYEGSNTVEMHYGAFTTAAARTTTGSVQVGLRGASVAATNVRSLANVGSWSTPTVGTSNLSTVALGNFTAPLLPDNGRVYRFAPGNSPSFTYAWSSTPAGFSSTASNPVVNPTETTTYTVQVTGNSGCVGTAQVTVNVVSGATITTEPVAVSQCAGTNATFSVVATGPTLTYQWRKDGVNITGNASALTSTLNLTGIAAANAGSYDVVVTPACGPSATSNAVALTVNAIPTATASNNGPVCEGSTLNLTGITDIGATYAWSGPAGFTSTALSPSVSNVTITNAGTYNLTVTSAAGCSFTTSTVVVILPNPTIAINPANDPLNACVGEIKTLSVATTSTGTNVILSENFNGATNGWIRSNTTTGTNGALAAWTLRPSPYTFGVTFTSNDASQFYLSDSDAAGSGSAVNAKLQSPSFSTLGYTAANVSYYHFYQHLVATQNVEYSIDGGTTWVSFRTYSATQGASGAFVLDTVALPAAALGQANVSIRFNYVDGWAWRWAIDNFKVEGTLAAPSFAWSPTTDLYSDANATIPYTGGDASTVYAKVNGPAAYTATSTNLLGCTRTDVVSFNITTSGCPSTTTVQPSQCGVTLPAINSFIYANLVSNAQGYRFRVTDMTTMQVQTIDKALRVFAITQLPTYAFNRTYQVEVSVRVNNVWQPFYGAPCMVTTPIPTTLVQSAQCGSTLTTMNDVIFANLVPFAAGYKFRITNLLTSEQFEFERPIRDIRLTNLPSPQFNTTYSIEVAVKNTNGEYFAYGTPCNVTSPSFPTTQVQTSQCDLSTSLPLTTTLFADSFTGATTYRFRFINGATTIQVDRPIRSIYLASVPGIQAGTAYSVSVALEINGTFGPFGKVCLVTTAGGARETEVVKPVSPFNAMAYPNPFAENFKLNVTTSVEESIQVKVYDMLGKLVENRTVDTAVINEVEIGANYPAGVYNVIVSQGSEVKTLRVIKR